MNYMDYGSNDEDDCSVEDVEFEAEHYDDQDRDLPAVSDLEFIAANAADNSFEFVDTGVGMHLENNHTNPVRSESGSDDDSEDESENEMATDQTNPLPAESSSDSSDSEDEIINKKQYQKKSQQINWLTEEEGDDATTGPLKTKNEIEEVIEPVEAKQLDIKDNTELVCIGEVKYRIDHECVVVIQADFTTNALNEGSTLCNIDGRVLGKIQEIFGPITTPYYTVRWKNPTAQANKLNAGITQNKKKKNNNKSKMNNNKQSGETVNATVVENEAPVGVVGAAAVDEPVVVASDSVAIEIEKDVSIEQSTASSSVMVEATAENPSVGNEAAPVVPEAPKPLQISDVRALFPVGAKLYTVQAHCSYVLASQMQRAHAKGSDASNAYDEEPPEDELEYSDDEQEMAAKAARKQAKKGAVSEAPFGDAIPSGMRPGGAGNKRVHAKPNARPMGTYGAPQQHQQQPPNSGGYGVPSQGGLVPPPSAFAPMNPAYMGGQYMQQPFYGQPGQMQMQYPMHPQYGMSNPGYALPYAQAPHMFPGHGQQGFPQQQPMYPPQPHMIQYPQQPAFIPAAAFVPGAYPPHQGNNSHGGQQPPQYQYQPLQYNNRSSDRK